MTHTKQRAGGSATLFGWPPLGTAFSFGDHSGLSHKSSVSYLAASINRLGLNVILPADTFSKWCYNQEFPGVLCDEVQKMNWRIGISGSDARPFAWRMRSSS